MHTENSFNTNTQEVNYLFLGLGAANTLLLMQMHKHNLLDKKKITIIDPDYTALTKKTYCFWGTETERRELGLEDHITHIWKRLIVNDKHPESITPLAYLHIPGSSICDLAKSIVDQYHIEIITEPYYKPIEKPDKKFVFELENRLLLADKVFDSRPPQFENPKKNQSHLWQSFIGWKIKSTKKNFDTSTAILMDFDIDQLDTCQFVYLLPFSSEEALVELTRFGETKITEAEANPILQEYLFKKNIDYTILEVEKGVIPMSTSAFNNHSLDTNWIYTGAKAGMLKPSTGYAFKAMAQDALAIASSLQKEITYHRKVKKSRFLFYDRLLLKILEQKPDQGKIIFQSLFHTISIQRVLQFLDEQTAIRQEVTIFSKLPIKVFLLAALKDIWFTCKQISPTILAFIFSLLSLLLVRLHYANMVWGILAIIFFTYGLSHGAIDHLTDKRINSAKTLVQFVSIYIAKGLLFAILWWITPTIALVGFIIFSAWHFGQADYTAWNVKNGFSTLLWGLCVLLLMLVFHVSETVYVLNQIPYLHLPPSLAAADSFSLALVQYATIATGLSLSYTYRSVQMLLTISYLLISSQFPLMVSFGIYFCFQHSLHGWKFLQQNLRMKSAALFKKSGPFTLGAILLFATMAFFYSNQFFGFFFILLSCMSIPHIFSMHRFYKKSYSGY
jgi:lycopene beta-cyclase